MGRERVLITGGQSGIGRAIADRCADLGHEPVIIDRIPGGIVADLASAEQTERALSEALEAGPITRLVNNVGAVCGAPLSEVTTDDFRTVMAVNVEAAIRCAQRLLPSMRVAGFGRIVNLSSRTILGKTQRSVYASSKAALVALARTWALELGRYGVTANAVAPGPIDTPMFRGANTPDQQDALMSAIPVGRIGQPNDVAAAVCYLLSDQAGYVTGQTLHVCGGMSVGRATF